MPIFTSLLLLFIALAILPLALRSNSIARERRDQANNEQSFATGALICEAAARDSFIISLDHSLESIATLDTIITEHLSINVSSEFQSDLHFTLASYLGDVFARHYGAKWMRNENGWIINFAKVRRTADPFSLIERKLREPEHINLQNETALLIQELDRLCYPKTKEIKIG